MKRFYLVTLLSFCALVVCAQSTDSYSEIGYLNLEGDVRPPYLSIENIKFVDASGNEAIDASEECKITFDVTNTGTGDAKGCVAQLTGTGSTAGVKFGNKSLSKIFIGDRQHIEMPITANMLTEDGEINFKLQIVEPHNWNSPTEQVNVQTYAFAAPKLFISENAVLSATSSVLERSKPFVLQAHLLNNSRATAENVSVSIELPQGVFILEGDQQKNFAKLDGYDSKMLEYQLATNSKYSAKNIPITIHIREKYGKYAEDKLINLTINQPVLALGESNATPGNVSGGNVGGGNAPLLAKAPAAPVVKRSEVDKAPKNPTTNTNTFAFIIANENYKNSGFSNVQYALNDGKTFRDYCEHTLGIPAKNITYIADATYLNMYQTIADMELTAELNNGSNILFYYAGHGAPTGESEALLIPTDAFQVSAMMCISLQSLYDKMRAFSDNRFTVFLDACFSGTNRKAEVALIGEGSRGVAIAPKKNKVEGNLVVFSAASGAETAWPYAAEGHGLFTYFLLKHLQTTNGETTYDDLNQFIYENVRKVSHNENKKLQNPTVNPSASLGDSWKTWTLR